MAHCRSLKKMFGVFLLVIATTYQAQISDTVEHDTIHPVFPPFIGGFHILNPCGHNFKSSLNVMTEAKKKERKEKIFI